MARLYLLRHGRAAQNWQEASDPGLDEQGRKQAHTAAADLAAALAQPLPILTSPLRRCQETAAPLAERWGAAPTIEPRVTELPSTGMGLDERAAWLGRVLRGTWQDGALASPQLQAWRAGVLAALLEQKNDVVIFTHFVALNVALGAVQDSERLVVFRPANASCSCLTNDGGKLQIVEQGAEDDSVVQ